MVMITTWWLRLIVQTDAPRVASFNTVKRSELLLRLGVFQHPFHHPPHSALALQPSSRRRLLTIGEIGWSAVNLHRRCLMK